MKCRKLTNGNWECYEEGPRDPYTNRRNPIRKQAKSKTAAQIKVKEAVKVLESGIDGRTANRVLFSETAAEWFELYAHSGVKNSTLRSRESTLKLIQRYIGDMLIGKITHKHIQDMMMDLHKKRASKSLITHVKVTTNFVFVHAQKQRLRLDNPVAFVVMPKRVKTVEEIESVELKENYFERSELEAFLQATRQHGLLFDEEWFYLLAFTGMRVGELCALKWTDIDLEEQRIRITKTIDTPGTVTSYSLTSPKSNQAIRHIEIDKHVVAMLKKLKVRQMESRMKYRATDQYHDEQFLFCRPKTGYPYSSKNIYRRYIRICEKAGIDRVSGPHILRHTHITMLTEAEIDLDTIMNRVGHSDAKTTKNIYTHVTKQMKRNAPNQLEIHYGEIFGKFFEA